MNRSEWMPLIVAATTVGVATIVLVIAMGARFRGDDDEPGDEKPRRKAPPEITLWVGEVQPGLKGALTDVYGDPGPDKVHDERLNERLGLQGDDALAFYRLLLFNTTQESQSFPVRDGGLVVRPKAGAASSLHNLAAAVERGALTVDEGVAFALGGLGTLRESVDIPAGSMANLVLAFDGAHQDLGDVERVETAEGTALRRLPMSRADFRRLVADPRVDRIKDL